MNIVILQGRPTDDPKMRNSRRTGKVFCTFRLAVDGQYRGPEAPREVDFINCVAFGKRAQALLRHLGKGAFVSLMGTLKNSTYVDGSGTRHDKNVVIVKEYLLHEWTKRSAPFESLSDSNGDLLVPREITDSLFKQINAMDEDIPDLNGGDLDDLFQAKF